MHDEDANVLDLSGLTVGELYEIAATNANYGLIYGRGFVLSLPPQATVEEVGVQIDRGEIGSAYFAPPLYWDQLKKEFRILLCTKDKKYQKLRGELVKTKDKTQLTVVSAIAAAVASSLGVVAGALVPVCAICLIAVLKLGTEAFCQAESLNVRIKSE